jgi:hypothetical protein
MKISKQRLKEIIREELKEVQESTVQVSRDIDANFRSNMVQLIGRKAKVPLTKKDLKALIRLVQKHMGRAYTEGKLKEGGNLEKIKLPSQVNRFLDKFVQSMKDANLNRMKRAAILFKVIDASGMSVQQLMQDIQKIKKELGEGKLTESVKFSSSQINQLVKAFKNVKGGVLPKNHPLMIQVTKLLKQTDKKTLQQIKSADIPYLSVIALDLLGEGKLTEGKKIELPSGVTIEIGMSGLKIYDNRGNPIPLDKKDIIKFLRASKKQLRLV